MPRYDHDCQACEFLGQYKEFDLYYCPQTKKEDIFGGSVIARRSSKDSDYMSGDLLIVLKSAVNELAYGNNVLSEGKESHLPPRQGSPLHVAVSMVLSSQRITLYSKLEKSIFDKLGLE
jgi:hypothetical protein